MKTTYFIVELLIAGVLALAALSPFAAWASETTSLEFLMALVQTPIHIQLAIAYVFGLIWNRICDDAFSPISKRVLGRYFESKEAYQEARQRILTAEGKTYENLFRLQGLVRVSRASSGAAAVLLLVALANPTLLTVPEDVKVGRLIVLLTVFVVLSTYCWYRSYRGLVVFVSVGEGRVEGS